MSALSLPDCRWKSKCISGGWYGGKLSIEERPRWKRIAASTAQASTRKTARDVLSIATQMRYSKESAETPAGEGAGRSRFSMWADLNEIKRAKERYADTARTRPNPTADESSSESNPAV
jgi:hypothetical protein